MKLKKWLEKRREEIQKGRMKLLEDRIKREQRKKKKMLQSKPGAVRAIREGLMLRKTPMQVMKEEYNRRRYERKKRREEKE